MRDGGRPGSMNTEEAQGDETGIRLGLLSCRSIKKDNCESYVEMTPNVDQSRCAVRTEYKPRRMYIYLGCSR